MLTWSSAVVGELPVQCLAERVKHFNLKLLPDHLIDQELLSGVSGNDFLSDPGIPIYGSGCLSLQDLLQT